MATDKNTIKNWFKTGLKPTEAQFWATWDSYFHKDDKIGIGSVENLENLLNNKANESHTHSQYATNDASSLTDNNIISWQKALKISDLKFDDKAITTTQDYSEFGLKAGATINEFNNVVYNKVKANVNENFANTDLDVLENRKHTGTASVDFGMPLIFSNPSQRFSSLQDKSNDATYTELLGSDSEGNIGKVGSTAIVGKLQKASDKDINTLFNTLNGAYVGASAIKVNAIYPLFLTESKETQEITLLGSGLNIVIDGLITKVRLIDLNDLTKPPVDVGYNPVSTSELKVLINPDIIKNGHSYKVEIISGIQRHVSTPYIDVVEKSKITNINTSNINWKYKDESNKNAIEINNSLITIPSQGVNANYNIIQEITTDIFNDVENNDFVFSFSIEQDNYTLYNRSIPIVGVRDSNYNMNNRSDYTNYIGMNQAYDGRRSLNMIKNCFGVTTDMPFSSITTIVITKRGDTYSYFDTQGTMLFKTIIALKKPKLFIGYCASVNRVFVSIKSLQVKNK